MLVWAVVDGTSLLVEFYGRFSALARRSVEGLTRDELVSQPGPSANSVAWLVWHAARVQDHHVAEIRGVRQVWLDGAWAARFGLDPDPSNTGYGHSPADVRAVRPVEPTDPVAYLDAVIDGTVAWLCTLVAEDLDRVVDRRFDPPVTMGVRLASVADDTLQHLGQAAYLRGLLGH